MKHYAFSLIFLISFFSCSLSEKEKLKQLEEQVLTQHDAVMSQMDKINQRQRKLKAYLQKADSTHMDTKLIQNQITDLRKADAAMMNWMHQYKNPADLSPENASIYLEDQLFKINQVKKQVTSALANTEKNTFK
ncbi:hypothetical protein [Adhaeribacter pallidiroseus]|nr:hypothetical protein [Adhaeribacter pallidiroseus]